MNRKFQPNQRVICVSNVYNNATDSPKKFEVVTIGEYSNFFDAFSLVEYPLSKFGMNQTFSECFFADANSYWAEWVLRNISEQIEIEQALIEYLLSTPKINGKS